MTSNHLAKIFVEHRHFDLGLFIFFHSDEEIPSVFISFQARLSAALSQPAAGARL
jgi:hypothetical protein